MRLRHACSLRRHERHDSAARVCTSEHWENCLSSRPPAPSDSDDTEQQVEKPNPGDPGSGLRVTTLSTDTVRPGPSGAQATRTIRVLDANGSFEVVAVDTTKSDNIHAIQVRIAPSEKTK